MSPICGALFTIFSRPSKSSDKSLELPNLKLSLFAQITLS